VPTYASSTAVWKNRNATAIAIATLVGNGPSSTAASSASLVPSPAGTMKAMIAIPKLIA
jgi:hypothetical protein